MIRIYILDDEKHITDQIHQYVTGYFIHNPREYEVKTFLSGQELLKETKNQRADIMFLDIELNDTNGIQVAKAVRQFDKKVKIIFITSYTNYKGEAFSVHAFGYIDKPITPDQIKNQLDEVQNYQLEEKGGTPYKFQTTDGLIQLALKDILYFVNENRKIKIVTFNNEYYMKQKLSVLEKQLLDHNFKSPHSSFLVNLDYVVDIKHYTVYMIQDIEIPLSQRRSIDFRESVAKYLARSVQTFKEKKYD